MCGKMFVLYFAVLVYVQHVSNPQLTLDKFMHFKLDFRSSRIASRRLIRIRCLLVRYALYDEIQAIQTGRSGGDVDTCGRNGYTSNSSWSRL